MGVGSLTPKLDRMAGDALLSQADILGLGRGIKEGRGREVSSPGLKPNADS